MKNRTLYLNLTAEDLKNTKVKLRPYFMKYFLSLGWSLPNFIGPQELEASISILDC